MKTLKLAVIAATLSAGTVQADGLFILGGMQHSEATYSEVQETHDVTLTHNHSFGPFSINHHMSGEFTEKDTIADRKRYDNVQTIGYQYKGVYGALKFGEQRIAKIGYQRDLFTALNYIKFGLDASVQNIHEEGITHSRNGDLYVGVGGTVQAGYAYMTFVPGQEVMFGVKGHW